MELRCAQALTDGLGHDSGQRIQRFLERHVRSGVVDAHDSGAQALYTKVPLAQVAPGDASFLVIAKYVDAPAKSEAVLRCTLPGIDVEQLIESKRQSSATFPVRSVFYSGCFLFCRCVFIDYNF